MPSPAAPEAPLRLRTGGDRFLRGLRRGLAVLAAMAIAFSLWPLPARSLGAASVLFMAAFVEWRDRRQPERRVVLQPDFRARVDGASATLLGDPWVTRRYAVLTLEHAGRRRRFLISASRQERGEYRKLLAWIRLRPWTSV